MIFFIECLVDGENAVLQSGQWFWDMETACCFNVLMWRVYVGFCTQLKILRVGLHLGLDLLVCSWPRRLTLTFQSFLSNCIFISLEGLFFGSF